METTVPTAIICHAGSGEAFPSNPAWIKFQLNTHAEYKACPTCNSSPEFNQAVYTLVTKIGPLVRVVPHLQIQPAQIISYWDTYLWKKSARWGSVQLKPVSFKDQLYLKSALIIIFIAGEMGETAKKSRQITSIPKSTGFGIRKGWVWIVAPLPIYSCVRVTQSSSTLCGSTDWGPPSTSVPGILPGKSTGVGFPSGKVLTFSDSLSPYAEWGTWVCVCLCVWQAYYPASGLFRADTQASPFHPPHQIWRQDT